MSSIKLDLKNFKHHSSDKDSTTLIHEKDGHKITLAHKPLSKENKAQLEAMIPKEKLADGGDVEAIGKDIKNTFDPVPTQEQETTYPSDSIRNSAIQMLGLPDELRETEADRMRWQAGAPASIGMGSMGTLGKVIPANQVVIAAEKMVPIKNMGQSISKVGGVLEQASKGANLEGTPVFEGKGMDSANKINTSHKKYLESLGPMKLADGGEVAPEYLTPNDKPIQQPITETIDQAALKSIDPTQPMSEGELYKPFDPLTDPGYKMLENKDTTGGYGGQMFDAKTMGYQAPEVSTPEQQAPGQMVQTPEQLTQKLEPSMPAQMPQQTQGQMQANPMDKYMDTMGKGFNDQLHGINAEAQAIGDLGKAQQQIIDRQVQAQQLAQSTYQQKYAELDNERKNFIDDINAQHIDPEKYWTGDPKTGMGSHSKIMAGIGMILAGFNPTNSPNAAINFINKQMDMNLEAQKQNLNSKHNLLAANMKQFGNLKDATDMTRLMQADMVKNQLMSAAATAQTPLAKAAALKSAGQLEMQYAPLQQQFAMRSAMMHLSNGTNGDPTDTRAAEQMISMARMTNPEMAKEMEGRLVPGVGMAKIPVPEKVRDEIISHQKLNTSVKDLQEFVKSHTTMNPMSKDYQVGAQKALDLQQALREAKLGGVFKEAEQGLLDKYVDLNPAGFMKAYNTEPKLRNILHSNQLNTNIIKRNYGLPTNDMSTQQSGTKQFNFKPAGK